MKLPTSLTLTVGLLLHIPAIAGLTYALSGTRHGVPIPDAELQASASEGPATGFTASPLQPQPQQSRRAAAKRFQHGTPAEGRRLQKRNLYSPNWSGVFIASSDVATQPVVQVGGCWYIPTPAFRAGTTDPTATQIMSEWLGIGGVFSDNMMYTGITQGITPDGNTTTSVWWEWYPEARVTWGSWEGSGAPFSPGDLVCASVEFQASTGDMLAGILDTNNGWTIYSVAVSGGPTLDFSSAEYIVYAENGDSFPTFGEVHFFNMWANAGTDPSSYTVLNLSKATVRIDLKQDGKIFSHANPVQVQNNVQSWFIVDSEE